MSLIISVTVGWIFLLCTFLKDNKTVKELMKNYEVLNILAVTKEFVVKLPFYYRDEYTIN